MQLQYANGVMDSLESVYESMPATKGCENCPEKNGDNAFWCCKLNVPSMYSVEFSHIWDYVSKEWDETQRKELLYRAIKNYLTNSTQKPCCFYDNGCLCYELRPQVCRSYGIVPQKNWDKHVKSLKKRFGPSYKIKNQCNLVKTESGEKVTPEQEDTWFKRIALLEKMSVPKHAFDLHDEEGGTYRTFHDFILLTTQKPELLMMLTKVKQSNPSEEDIDKFIETLRGLLEKEESRIIV